MRQALAYSNVKIAGKGPEDGVELPDISHKSNALSAAAYSKKSASIFSRAKPQSKQSGHARSHT